MNIQRDDKTASSSESNGTSLLVGPGFSAIASQFSVVWRKSGHVNRIHILQSDPCVFGGAGILSATGDHKNVTLELRNGVEMKCVLIPAGEFLMGSPKLIPGRTSASLFGLST